MFYERLIRLCSDNGINLTNLLTNELHMSSGNLTKWKNGNVPKADTLQKIAAYFDVSVDYLLGSTEIKKAPAEAEAEDDFLFALSGEVRDFTSEEKQEIIDYVKYLRQKYKK